MAIENLIERLQVATGPDRTLDLALARLVGYRREVNQDTKAVHWFTPSGEETKIIPSYTASVDAAVEFAKALHPSHAAAITTCKPFKATVNDGIQWEGVNPAVALCIASLSFKGTS